MMKEQEHKCQKGRNDDIGVVVNAADVNGHQNEEAESNDNYPKKGRSPK